MAKIHRLRPRTRAGKEKASGAQLFVFRLFTGGSSPRSSRAIQNLSEICELNLKGNYRLEVIDIYQEPGRASEADIIAAPTLIKAEPLPRRRLVGDLSDRRKVLLSLSIGGAAS
jgi:circadian clock protein KaiB